MSRSVFTGIHSLCILELHLDPSPARRSAHCTLTLFRRILWWCHFDQIFVRSLKKPGSQDNKLSTCAHDAGHKQTGA